MEKLMKTITAKCPSCEGNMTPENIRGPFEMGESKKTYFLISWQCHDKNGAACNAGAITVVSIDD